MNIGNFLNSGEYSIPMIDLNALEVTDDGLPYVLHVYEMNKTRPTRSFAGTSIISLQQIAANIVGGGGMWVDLVFYPMHMLGKFVIEYVGSESIVDEW